MNIIKSITGAIKKKLNDKKLTSQLVSSIGPEGIIGLRNMDKYTKIIGKMVGKGDVQGAMEYARNEKYKVLNQK